MICIVSARSPSCSLCDRSGRHASPRVQGERRFRVLDFQQGLPYSWRASNSCRSKPQSSSEIEARALNLKRLAAEAIALLPQAPAELANAIQSLESPSTLVDLVASFMDVKASEKSAAARDARSQGASGPGVASCCAPYRGAAAAAPDRRADARSHRRAPARRSCCASRCTRSRRSSARKASPAEEIAGAARSDRQGRHAGGSTRAGRQGAEAPGAHVGRERRVLDAAHLARLDDPAAVVEARRGSDRHRERASRPRRGSLRARQDQAAHPRVPRRAQAESAGPQPDPVLRRSARRRQDLARPEHRARTGPEVRAREPRRRARRGGDPRPSAHLHRRAAGQHHPGHRARRARATRC